MITEVTTEKVLVGDDLKCRRITGLRNIQGKDSLPAPYIGSYISDRPAYWLVDSRVRLTPKDRANRTFFVGPDGTYSYNKLKRGEFVNHVYVRAPLHNLKEIEAFKYTLKDYPKERKLIISNGDIFTESDFQKIVKSMNQAGHRLIELQKDPWEGSFTVDI